MVGDTQVAVNAVGPQGGQAHSVRGCEIGGAQREFLHLRRGGKPCQFRQHVVPVGVEIVGLCGGERGHAVQSMVVGDVGVELRLRAD